MLDQDSRMAAVCIRDKYCAVEWRKTRVGYGIRSVRAELIRRGDNGEHYERYDGQQPLCHKHPPGIHCYYNARAVWRVL
jgi:hypothetical protein